MASNLGHLLKPFLLYLKLKQNSWKLGRGYSKVHICKTRRFFAHFRAVGTVWGRRPTHPLDYGQFFSFKRRWISNHSPGFSDLPTLWTLTTKYSLHIKAPTLMQLVTRCEKIVQSALRGLKSKK